MIYSVDYTVIWLESGYFSTLSTFLVRKSFKGSFWDSYPSKNCQRLICQGHFDAFDVSFKILNHPEMSSNGLERFSKGQQTPSNKNFSEISKLHPKLSQPYKNFEADRPEENMKPGSPIWFFF